MVSPAWSNATSSQAMTQQQQLDLIIVTIYLISVVYVLFRAIDSVEDQTTVKFDKSKFESELEEKNLKDVIDIGFKFEDRYPYDKQPRELAISIENKSKIKCIDIYWDRSVINAEGRSRRVIRIPSDKRVGLTSSQVPGVIHPGETLKEKVTAEDLLKFTPETQLWETTDPIIDIAAAKKKALEKKPREKERVEYEDFASSKTTKQFFIRVALRVYDDDMTDVTDIDDMGRIKGGRSYALVCNFEVKKVLWQELLPLKL